jgi:hypothetical protein
VINWSRQIGYVVGIAVLVAVFSHAMTSELNGAVADAKVAVAKQTALPAKTRTAIGTGITDIVAAAQKSGQTPSLDGLQKQLAASAPRDAASSTAITRLVADLKNGFTDARFNAFYWPFMVAALIALLGALPGFAFGRRRTAIAARPETELPGADACPAPE